jgi:hypothetical protein
MSTYKLLDDHIKESMKNKDMERLNTLRGLKSAIKYEVMEKKGAQGLTAEITDAEIIPVIRREIKKRQESAEIYKTNARPELAQKEENEIKILEAYLPQGLSSDEALKIVLSAIEESGATSKAQMGQVMKVVQEKAAGRVDNKTLSQLVQQNLK